MSREVIETYPPSCGGCGGQMQPMAHGSPLEDGRRKVVMVCEICDGPTLETMWGPLAAPEGGERPDE